MGEVDEVLQLVEDRSGARVEVEPDPGLQTYASTRMARGHMHAHLLTYNPDKPGTEYHIAYQCGFILRIFDIPTEERLELAGNGRGKQLAREQLGGKGGVAENVGLPEPAVEQLAEQMSSGLLVQLRSYPIGIRIDQWIRDSYPGLHEAQEQSIDQQQRENARMLGPQIKQMTPSIIFSGNASMNAAYALFCDSLLGRAQYTVSYRSVGYEESGRRLLELCDSIPSEPGHDVELIDAWGEELGVSDWYEWVPFNSRGE